MKYDVFKQPEHNRTFYISSDDAGYYTVVTDDLNKTYVCLRQARHTFNMGFHQYIIDNVLPKDYTDNTVNDYIQRGNKIGK